MGGLQIKRRIGTSRVVGRFNGRIVPILGTMPIGIGMMGIFLPAFIYVIEAFGFYAASAIASLYIPS